MMDPNTYIDPQLTIPDRLVLDCLLSRQARHSDKLDSGYESQASSSSAQDYDGVPSVPSSNDTLAAVLRRRTSPAALSEEDAKVSASTEEHDSESGEDESRSAFNDRTSTISHLQHMNDPGHQEFEPNVFVTWDLPDLNNLLPMWCREQILGPYIRWARTVIRSPTDVVMVTHLLLYLTTTAPSVLRLFYSFSYIHGLLHLVMQLYLMGTYTLM